MQTAESDQGPWVSVAVLVIGVAVFLGMTILPDPHFATIFGSARCRIPWFTQIDGLAQCVVALTFSIYFDRCPDFWRRLLRGFYKTADWPPQGLTLHL